MLPLEKHEHQAHASFDGGDLDCGNGLLLLIRRHLDRLESGQLLEIRSVEPSVDEDLPAWCRLTKNELISWTKQGSQRSFLICKAGTATTSIDADVLPVIRKEQKTVDIKSKVVAQSELASHRQSILPLSVMGIGSWPRPQSLIPVMHQYLEGKVTEENFQAQADAAIKLAVSMQEDAGADVITDGEQRRDNYASFVGKRLENCQLIPLVDLLPLVEHPEDFQRQMEQLDVPASVVRHPAVHGRIRRTAPLAAHEATFLRTLTDKPIKVSLPGPYLLTRTMYMDCFKDKAYNSREDLSGDIVQVLREEIAELLHAGAAIVQLDEPILTEVVFSPPGSARTFMCGALSERRDSHHELGFAVELINSVARGFSSDRLAIHVCRGNWSADESVALEGGYAPLLPVFRAVNVGMLFLEFCTGRAGDLDILSQLPSNLRVGLGVVNPKARTVESVDSIVIRVKQASRYISLERILLNPDCGFATFADNPVSSSETAALKLAAITQAAKILRSQ